MPNNKHLQTKCINYGGKEMKRRFINASKKVLAIAMSTAMMMTSIVVSNPMEVNAMSVPDITNTAGFTGNLGEYSLTGDFALEFNFHTKTDNLIKNWDSFCLDINSGASVGNDSNNNGVEDEWGFLVLRADNWGWWNGDWYGAEGVHDDNIVKSTDANWDKWAETISNADVNVKLELANEILTVVMTIVGTNGETVVQNYTITNDYGWGTKMNVKLTTCQEAGDPSATVTITDATVKQTVNNAAGFANKPATKSFTGDFDITYTFNTKSTAMTNNWDTFGIEINDGATFIDLRADNYGWWWTGARTDTGLTAENWTSNVTDWNAFKEALIDADVTVNVVRTGDIFDVEMILAGANGSTYVNSISIDASDKNMGDTATVFVTSVQDANTVTLTDVFMVENDIVESSVETVGAAYRVNPDDAAKYDLAFATTIDITEFSKVKEMGVVVINAESNDPITLTAAEHNNKIKAIGTNYVTDCANLSINDDGSYAFRTVIKGISDTAKDYTAVPYVVLETTEGDVTVYGDACTRNVADLMQ